MSIESEIFKKAVVDFAKLEAYGFEKQADGYTLQKIFKNGDFRADVSVDKQGNVSGKVYEIATDEEFLPLRVENMGGFAGEVRFAYQQILEDIKYKCFICLPFITAQSNRLATLIKNKYGDNPQFLFKKQPGYGVFKNPDNNKWYGMIMNTKAEKLDKNISGETEIIHVKLTEEKVQTLLPRQGFYPSFKKNWICIALDDTLKDDEIMTFIDESHAFTIKPTKTRRKHQPLKDNFHIYPVAGYSLCHTSEHS